MCIRDSIKIDITGYPPNDEGFTKLNTALQSGQGIDLWRMPSDRLPGWVKDGLASPIDEYLTDADKAEVKRVLTEALGRVRSMAPAGSAFMAVVKADAYGHGLIGCARAAAEVGCEWLAVARVTEAMRLRAAGITTPTLVLGPPVSSRLAEAIRADVTFAAGSWSMVEALCAAAREAGQPARVHVKVDIGMRRYGFMPDELPTARDRLTNMNELDIDGVFSHFSRADEPGAEPAGEQLSTFSADVKGARNEGINPRSVPLSYSPGITPGGPRRGGGARASARARPP